MKHDFSTADEASTAASKSPVPITERLMKARTCIQSQAEKETASCNPTQGTAGMMVAIAEGLSSIDEMVQDEP